MKNASASADAFQSVDKVRHTRAGFFFCGLIGRFLEIYQLISVIIEVS